ncbi:hypothetical protein [Amycolatopsis sp. NPDC051102]|uniref:hypothetical protein n=1 Tax=Amycolatopsis sp. NPDC051102 TaxID=3155163 RepID=UPI003434BEEB
MDDTATSATSRLPISRVPLPDLAGFTHRWIEGDGVRLHAVEGGRAAGPVVVLLAGFRRPGGRGAR